MDQPDMAAFQDYMMTMDPATGKVPRERLLDACRNTIGIQKEKSGRASLLWQEHPADMGGRARVIMYDPNDPAGKKVWAGAVTGGLWYNNDIQSANSPWVPVGDFWPVLAIRCMAYDPNNPQVFYIGTGEVETAMQTYRESSGMGDGIWRSNDGGQSWDLLPSTTGFPYITKILVRNENGNSVIYAGVASGLYQGKEHQSSPTDGLYRSTDQGNSWQQVLPNIPGMASVPYAVSDIVESVGGRIFVGTRPNLDGNGGATILYSDDGLSWTVNSTYRTEILNSPQYNLPGRVVLATAPSDPNMVYALIASGFVNAADHFNYYYCFHVLRSANNGANWAKMSYPAVNPSFAWIAWHALDIGVDPNSANTVYIGGGDIFRSVNGGTNWTKLSDYNLMHSGGGPQYIHADQHCIVFKPGSSSEILFGTDGGIFYSANGNTSSPVFEEHSKSFNTLQFYSCAINPLQGSNEFIGGMQDNASLHYSGATVNIHDVVDNGDGANCYWSALDPAVFFTSMQYNVFYMYRNGNYVKSFNISKCGIFLNPGDYDFKLDHIYSNATDFIGNRANMIMRFNSLTTVGTTSLILLNTNNPVWFSSVRYSPYSPPGKSTIFLGTVAGRLFRVGEAQTDNPVVSEITGANFPLANISSIAIAGSEDTLLVTFSNYGVSSVFQSCDGGITWQDKDSNLPDMPVRWCLYHPQNSRQALLATETGVWSTTNLQAANTVWTPDASGMPNVRTDMMVVRNADNTVLAATHGRGCFTASWDVIYSGIRDQSLPEFSVFPNPARDHVSVTMDLPLMSAVTLRLYNAKGLLCHESEVTALGKYFKRIELGGFAKGLYSLEIQCNGRHLGATKIIVY